MRAREIGAAVLFLLFAGGLVAQPCTPPDATIAVQAPSADGYVWGGHTFGVSVTDAGAGATYEWSVGILNIGQFHVLSGQGTANATIEADVLRSDSVSVKVTTACDTSTGTKQITTIPQIMERPYAVFDASPEAFGYGNQPRNGLWACANETYSIAAENYSGALIDPARVYNWQIAGGTILSGQGTPNVTFRAGPPGPLNWSVMAVDRCERTSPLLSGSWQSAIPESELRLSGPPYLEPGSSGNTVYLDNPGSVFSHVDDFHWVVSNGSIPLFGDQFGTPLIFTAGSSGYVTVTPHLLYFCPSIYTPSLRIPIRSYPPVIQVPGTACMSGDTTAMVPPQPSATYQWTVVGGHLTSGQGTPQVTFMPDGSASQVVLTAEVNSAAYTSVLDVEPVPDAMISTAARVAPGSTNNQATAGDAGPGAAYTWDITNGTVASDNGRSVTFTAGDLGAVTLSVLTTTLYGCTATATAAVPIQCDPWTPAALHITVSGTSATCTDALGGPCGRDERIHFGVQSASHVVDSCDDVTWHIGTQTFHGPAVETTFAAPGVYSASVEVRNAMGTAVSQRDVTIVAPHRRAAGH